MKYFKIRESCKSRNKHRFVDCCSPTSSRKSQITFCLKTKTTKLTGYDIAICMVVALGGFTYGFGFAVFVLSIGQPGFYTYFNLDRKPPVPFRT